MRMSYYYRLSLIVAIALGLSVTVPYGGNLALIPVKVISIWVGFIMLKYARDYTITVTLSNAATELQLFISQLMSLRFLAILAGYSLATWLIFFIIFVQSSDSLSVSVASSSKTIKPYLNDNYMLFWYFASFLSLFYSVQFMVFQKNRLDFKIGTYRTEPSHYLKNMRWTSLFKETVAISGCICIFAAPVYALDRGAIFKLFFAPITSIYNLNSSIPAPRYSFELYTLLCIICVLTVFTYEILNRIYNAYAMAGCLVIKKPLSTYSIHFFDNLMSGVRDYKDSVVRLTAYQELVYRSTCTVISDRQCFYQEICWNPILSELSRVIRNCSNASRYGLNRKDSKKSHKKSNSKYGDADKTIFGRLGKTGLDPDTPLDKPYTGGNLFSSKSSSNPDDLFLKPKRRPSKSEEKSNQINSLIADLGKSINNNITKYKKIYMKKLDHYLRTRRHNSRLVKMADTAMKSDIWDLILSRSYKREADRRIPNKIIVGNAISTLSEMLLHAKSEDIRGTVEGSLPQVLTLLTSVYKSTTMFLDNPPVRWRNTYERDHNAVKEINDLAISYFFKLVVFYNSSLNDFILSPDTFKLAKWCTDLALEEQRAQDDNAI